MMETPASGSSGYIFGAGKDFVSGEDKRNDGLIAGRTNSGPRENTHPWLPPGTRQEETWRLKEIGGVGI